MKKKVCRIGLAAALCLLIPAILHGSEESIIIRLKPAVEVVGPEAKLGEVADISGTNADTTRMFSGITICRTVPEKGEMLITNRDIEAQLIKSHISLENVIIDGSREIVVSGKSKTISSKDLEETVRQYIYKNMPWDRDEVTIEFTQAISDIKQSLKEVEFNITGISGTNYLGFNQFAVRILSKGELKQRIIVNVNIRVFKQVLVSRKQLNKRSVLTGDDVETQKRELTDMTRKPFISTDEAIGKRLKVSIAANSILYESLVEDAPVITKNQFVTIRGRKGAVLITTTGRAMEEGKIGDCIQVMNLESKKIIVGKVAGPEIVEILTVVSNREKGL